MVKKIKYVKFTHCFSGTAILNESLKLSQILDIYKDANKKYQQIHSKNPGNSKGVTVNVNVVIGSSGGYTKMSIYDISTHRYLSRGKIVNR